jgi:hypothetical protein
MALAAAACGHEPAPPLVGVSTPRAPESPARTTDAAAPPGSAVSTDVRAKMLRLSDRFQSRGHGDQFDAVVWANDAARAALDTGSDAHNGAIFVEETLAPATPEAHPDGQLSMEKRDGAWHFVAVGPDGDLAGESRILACEACHRDAPRDFTFRPPAPRVAAQANTAASSATITAIAPTAVATPAATYDAKSAGSADLPSRR